MTAMQRILLIAFAGLIAARALASDADLSLNESYKALMSRLEDGNRDRLRDAQRAWLAFRDKDCAARAGRFGSNAGPATESTCRMESTAYRAQQLEDWRNSVRDQSSD